MVLAFSESLGLGWGVPACFVLLSPPISAGTGLGNLAVLLWPRIRFLSFWGWVFGVFLRVLSCRPPPAQCRGWSEYSSRSIVAQDVFSEFWAGFGMVPSFFFQAEDGIRDCLLSRGLGDVYKRQS